MRLVRSDEAIRTGEVVPIDTLRALAARWYGDRLDPGWRPRSVEASQAILDEVGLTGPFWNLSRSRSRP
jgi:hypothetical protein